MTEAEWDACADPGPMLEFLRGKASNRKLRLFTVACCRRVWNLMEDERSRRAIQAAEEFADGVLGQAEQQSMRRQALDAASADGSHAEWAAQRLLTRYVADCFAAHDSVHPRGVPQAVVHAVGRRASAGVYYADRNNEDAAALIERARAAKTAAEAAESNQQCPLLRCIFGSLPFRPITIDPCGLTSPVTQLATAIYEERAFDRMPILGDALEDAGCTNASILEHCRSGGEHVRGCWVVDLVLGKK